MQYRDPGYIQGDPQWEEFVAAIKNGGRVILTKGHWSDAPENKSGEAVARTGYIAVFEVEDVVTDTESLRFSLGKRLIDLM
ncbi:hypothetical protein [Blastomonas fulva]|uniref:hypothetical protein n=1 Tax=Blastomonas fulva TaxID=1550728 RepID=UPI003F6F4751